MELGAGDFLALEQAECLLDRQSEGVDHAVGGTLKRSASRAGAFAKTSSSGSDGPRLVLGPGVHELERMRGRRHVGEIELAHLRDRLQDRAQLAGQALDLLVGQLEARQPGDVEHFLAGDCHRLILPNYLGTREARALQGFSRGAGSCPCPAKKGPLSGALRKLDSEKGLTRL